MQGTRGLSTQGCKRGKPAFEKSTKKNIYRFMQCVVLQIFPNQGH
jgi:hypothetical protein